MEKKIRERRQRSRTYMARFERFGRHEHTKHFSVPFESLTEARILIHKYRREGCRVSIDRRRNMLLVAGEPHGVLEYGAPSATPFGTPYVTLGSESAQSTEGLHALILEVQNNVSKMRSSHQVEMHELQNDLYDSISRYEVDLYEISQELSELKRNSYRDKFLLQSGVQPDYLPQEFPVRVFLGEEKNTEEVEHSIMSLLDQLDSEFIEDYQAISGSWLKEWVARTFYNESNEELKKDLERARKAIEIQTLSLPQSEVDKNNSEAVLNILSAIKEQDNAAIQVGALLIVKNKDSNGQSQVAAKILNVNQLIALEQNPQWIAEPHILLERLSADDEEDKSKLTGTK